MPEVSREGAIGNTHPVFVIVDVFVCLDRPESRRERDMLHIGVFIGIRVIVFVVASLTEVIDAVPWWVETDIIRGLGFDCLEPVKVILLGEVGWLTLGVRDDVIDRRFRGCIFVCHSLSYRLEVCATLRGEHGYSDTAT
jgi:hypothetical protein